MKTLRLILTKGNNIYPDPNDNSKDLFRRLTGESSELPFISLLEFNNTICPILIDYGIKYKIYREGEETLIEAVIEAVNILEKMICDYESSYYLKEKAINLLKKAIP
jgi:hypothetical protein